MKKHIQQKGFMLLLSILVSSLALAIGATVLHITLKQLQLAGISKSSEISIHAADAGIECLRYWDISDDTKFNINENVTNTSCFGKTASEESGASSPIGSGDEQRYKWEWTSGTGLNAQTVCTNASIYKIAGEDKKMLDTNKVCKAGYTCTVIKSRGYNKKCSSLSETGTVEREFTIVY